MEIRKVQELVEEECDKMEYEGSLMFDEYPDRLMLRQICKRIRDKAGLGETGKTWMLRKFFCFMRCFTADAVTDAAADAGSR